MFFSNLKIPATYHLISTVQKLDWLLGELEKSKFCGLDIETNWPTAKISVDRDYPEKVAGISFAWGRDHFENPWTPGNAAYVPLIKTDDSDYWKTKQNSVVEKLKNYLEAEAYKVAQNGKFDVSKLFLLLGIQTKGFKFDTMLSHSVCDEARVISSHALKSDFDEEGNITKVGMSDAFLDTSASQFKDDLKSALAYYDPHYKRYSKVPIDVLFPYAASDSDMTLALKFVFEQKMEEEGLTWLFDNLIMPLQHTLMLMELKGVPVDIARAKQVIAEQLAIMDESQKEVWAIVGKEFNVGSNDQLGEMLFETLKLPGRKGEHHKWKVDVDALANLNHPVVESVLKYRRAQKIQSTYAAPSIELMKEVTDDGKIGWVHTTYWIDSLTGRLRNSDPNFANLPRPENGGMIVKSLFVAPEDYMFIFMDESQIELRVAANASGEASWIESFKNGEDLHARTAKNVFKLDCDVSQVKKLYKEQRSAAKVVNFGILYGETIFSLADSLGISYEEADKLINEDYFGSAPQLKKWIDDVQAFVRENGWVSNLFGRRRHLPEAMVTIPQSMKWPDDSVRPQCYRKGPYPNFLGLDPNDLYKVSEFDIKQLIKSKGNMNLFSHCLSCNYVLSCSVNREVKYQKAKLNGALRQAVNFGIQSGAVDMVSSALIQINQELQREEMDAYPLLHIHDELAILSHVSCVEKTCKIMKYYLTEWLEKFSDSKVPLDVDVAVVKRWSDKHLDHD